MKYDLTTKDAQISAFFYLTTLSDKKAKIELKELRNVRTLSQNAYLHVCISIFAIELGYTIEEAKTHLKRKCKFMRYEKANEVFLKQTSKCDSKELTDFIEWIRNYAGFQGIEIPSADDYKLDKIRIDNYIDDCKNFL